MQALTGRLMFHSVVGFRSRHHHHVLFEMKEIFLLVMSEKKLRLS